MNSKWSKKFTTGVIVLLIMVCFVPALALAGAPGDQRQGKGFDMKGPHGPILGIWRNPQMVQNLELTENQIKQIKDVDFTFREKCLALKAQTDSLRLQMDKALSDDIFDNTAVLSTAKKISDMQGKMFVQEIESRLALGKILNADQIKKINLYDMHLQRQGSRHDEKPVSRPQSMERLDNKKPLEN